MSNLAPCPCGQTPDELVFIEGESYKYGFVVGACCHEWHIEFRTSYLNVNPTPEREAELEKLMVRAWNEAPRPR